jgi:ParB/RepB/Spo0J family partition protein
MAPEPKRPACTLAQIHPAYLIPVEKDLRTRDGSAYMAVFDRFLGDVRDRGVQQPIIAYRIGERAQVLDGETRRQISLLAGCESVPVLLYDQKPSPEEMLVGQLQANALRSDMTPLEYAQVYQRLMIDHGWTQAQLAERLHVSPGDVSKTLAISSGLADALKERVAAGTLAVSVAYALTKLRDHGQQIALADEADQRKWKRDTVEARVKQLLGKKVVKEKPVKGRTPGGLQYTAPGSLGWQAFMDEVKRLQTAAERGLKQNLPFSILPELAKG